MTDAAAIALLPRRTARAILGYAYVPTEHLAPYRLGTKLLYSSAATATEAASSGVGHARQLLRRVFAQCRAKATASPERQSRLRKHLKRGQQAKRERGVLLNQQEISAVAMRPTVRITPPLHDPPASNLAKVHQG